jgi:aspirochlorine biosynthesis cytochrome P450 monooxygenase
MHLVACRLLYCFDIEVLPGQDDWIDRQKALVVWIKPPLNVKLTPRKDLQHA